MNAPAQTARLGTPLSPAATRVMLLGSGELGKEVLIALQRLGVETIAVDRYENAPGQQVAHHARTIAMSDAEALRALIEVERPDIVVPEIEAIATPVLEAFISKVREVNYEGSHYLRTRQVPDKAAARDRLAAMAGCAPDELIITRNTTESLDTVISGYDWKQGDEAVMAEQDYGHMLAQFRLTARRHGMVNTLVSLPMDPRTDDEIVQLYANAITPRTRLLMVL